MRKPVHVSDHAVLRYLERVGGFEIEALRKNMEQRVAASLLPGAIAVVIGGHRFVIKQGPDGPVVVSVLDAGLAVTCARDGGQA